MGQHPESTHKNQHYASFPGFLAKKQEFQSLQCRGRKGRNEFRVASERWRAPRDVTRSVRLTSNPKQRENLTPRRVCLAFLTRTGLVHGRRGGYRRSRAVRG